MTEVIENLYYSGHVPDLSVSPEQLSSLIFSIKLSPTSVCPQKSFREPRLTTESSRQGSDGYLRGNAAWSPAACTLL